MKSSRIKSNCLKSLTIRSVIKLTAILLVVICGLVGPNQIIFAENNRNTNYVSTSSTSYSKSTIKKPVTIASHIVSSTDKLVNLQQNFKVYLPIMVTTSNNPDPRKITSFQIETIEHNKLLILQNDPNIMPMYNALIESANGMVKNNGPYSVTFKTQIPPSGDKHDFLSQSPYWWPNPKTTDSLPYIYEDGQINPVTLLISDQNQFNLLVRDVNTLSEAYYLSGNEKYAQKTMTLLRTWFTDPSTQMNPNLEYSQFIPGNTQKDGSGIIDTREITIIIDSFLLVYNSPNVTRVDFNQLYNWFSKYLNWLMTSERGMNEAKTVSNHKTWYNQQVASILVFLGRTTEARSVIEETKTLIANQISPDGKQPLELARTKSWWYSNTNLEALQRLAIVGNNLGIDLKNYISPTGSSIKKALDYLVPYMQNPSLWLYENNVNWDNTWAAINLYNGARLYNNNYYQKVADNLQYVTVQKWRQCSTKTY